MRCGALGVDTGSVADDSADRPKLSEPPDDLSGLERVLPAKDRKGKAAWLGPASIALALVSWVVPFGWVVALAACACGALSIGTRREYRIDWTAVVGSCLGGAQVFVELVLFAMSLSGL